MSTPKHSKLMCVVALSVLAGNGWILTEAYPSDIGFPFAGCIHCALIACIALPLCLRSLSSRHLDRSSTPTSSSMSLSNHHLDRSRAVSSHGAVERPPHFAFVRAFPTRFAQIALAGATIFLLPTAAVQLTADGISSGNSASLFAAIPLMIVLASNAQAETSARQFLVPSLVGLSGMFLLVPHDTPHTPRRILCLAAIAGCCMFIAIASLRLHSALQGVSIATAAALVGITGAIALGLDGLSLGWLAISPRQMALEALRAAAFDLPLMFLTLWLTREIPPIRLSARFLLAPLVTVLEGYAFLRVHMELTRIAALILIAVGAAMLLLRNERDESEELPALHLR